MMNKIKINKTELKKIHKITALMIVLSILFKLLVIILLKYTSLEFKQIELDLLNLILIGPILEELLFRGLILKVLKRFFNIRNSIILSSVLFAMLHQNFIQMIYTFMLGIVFANIKEKDNILYSIYAHMVYNCMAILIS